MQPNPKRVYEVTEDALIGMLKGEFQLGQENRNDLGTDTNTYVRNLATAAAVGFLKIKSEGEPNR